MPVEGAPPQDPSPAALSLAVLRQQSSDASSEADVISSGSDAILDRNDSGVLGRGGSTEGEGEVREEVDGARKV